MFSLQNYIEIGPLHGAVIVRNKKKHYFCAMAQSTDLLRRYIWLTDLVYRHGKITFEEVARAWCYSALNPHPGEPLPRRSFVRHRREISVILGVEIRCDKSTNTYYIADREALERGSTLARMIDTLAIENELRRNPELRSRILTDYVPDGEQWLPVIAGAMAKNLCVTMEYRSFHNELKYTEHAEPYCLKSYGRRWYLLARIHEDFTLTTFGLDRIISLEVSDETFVIPDHFDAAAFFADFMGVITDHSVKKESVTVAVDEDFAPHMRNVPLHPSQKEGRIRYPDGSEDATFEWSLRPTPDFLMELYRYGSSLEVLSPKWVRDTIARWATHHSKLYGAPDDCNAIIP